MGKTYKDQKKNKKFDNRITEHKSGVKKEWKRRSNKKIRHTPVTKEIVAYENVEHEVTIRIPQNIVKVGIPTLKEIRINITIAIPYLEEVEIAPKGLDIWDLD